MPKPKRTPSRSKLPKSVLQRKLERKEDKGVFRYAVKVSFTAPRKKSGKVQKARYTKTRGEYRTNIIHKNLLIQRRVAYLRTKAEATSFLRRQQAQFLKSKKWKYADGSVQLVAGRVINKHKGTLAKGSQASPMVRSFQVAKTAANGRRRKKALVASQIQNKFTVLLDSVFKLMERIYEVDRTKKKKKATPPARMVNPEAKTRNEARFEMNREKRALEEKALMDMFRAQERAPEKMSRRKTAKKKGRKNENS